MPEQLNEHESELLGTLSRLTEVERRAAYRDAESEVRKTYGPKPKRQDYKNTGFDEYPRWMYVFVATLVATVLTFLFLVSIFRVYTAGSIHFKETMNEFLSAPVSSSSWLAMTATASGNADVNWQSQVVGVAMFAGAETLVMICVLAWNILMRGSERYLLAVPIFLGTAIALIGNAIVTKPTDPMLDGSQWWSILETVAPPLGVLFVAFILERLMLRFVQARFQDEQNYQTALKKWQDDTKSLRAHPDWRDTLANILRDYIRKVNGIGSGRGSPEREAIMRTMTDDDWHLVVGREMTADGWFSRRERPNFQQPPDTADKPMPLADGRGIHLGDNRPLLPTPANTNDKPTDL